MKRQTAIKHFIKCLGDSDIAIFSGKELSADAAAYDRDNFIYILDNEGLAIPIALGMGMTTDKRIFLFCTGRDLMRSFNAAMQVGIAKTENVFLIVIDDSVNTKTKLPDLFEHMFAPSTALYAAGFFVQEYTNVIEEYKRNLDPVKGAMGRFRGATVVVFKTTKGASKDVPNIDFDKAKLKNRMTNFMFNMEVS